MDISEGEIHESPGINAYGSLIAGELSGEDENIDVTGEVRKLSKDYIYARICRKEKPKRITKPSLQKLQKRRQNMKFTFVMTL